jgi:ferredoxin
MADPGEEQRIEVAVDRDRCMSSTACVSLAPSTFEIDDEGISTVRLPLAGDLDSMLDAAESCPVRAISVRVNGAAVS